MVRTKQPNRGSAPVDSSLVADIRRANGPLTLTALKGRFDDVVAAQAETADPGELRALKRLATLHRKESGAN